MNHDDIESLLAARALDGLDTEDTDRLDTAMADHGDCEECRRLAAGFDETAGRLGFLLEPAQVDASVADDILADRVAVPTPVPSQARRAVATPNELAARRSARVWRVVAGLAAAIAVVAGTIALLRPAPSGSVTLTRTIKVLEGPGDGTLAVAYLSGRPGTILWGQGIPHPGEGKTYEVWTISNDVAVSQGCLVPDADGNLAAVLPIDPSDADVMAVTIESLECPSDPTTSPVFMAPINA